MTDLIGQELNIGDIVLHITPGKGSIGTRLRTIKDFHGTTQVSFEEHIPNRWSTGRVIASRCLKLSDEQISYLKND